MGTGMTIRFLFVLKRSKISFGISMQGYWVVVVAMCQSSGVFQQVLLWTFIPDQLNAFSKEAASGEHSANPQTPQPLFS